EQAATSASRSAAAGPATDCELDSWPKACCDSRTNATATSRRATFMSIFRHGENLGQLCSELRAWDYLLKARCFRLGGEVRLYVRQESDHGQRRLLLAQLPHGFERSVVCV